MRAERQHAKEVQRAMKVLNKAIELSNFFLPHDGWMKPKRAEKANAIWQRMRAEMGNLSVEIAKEANDWKDEN